MVPVLLVIAQHWVPVGWVRVASSSVGVTTFFVLSGYFVTNILQRAQGAGTFWQVAKPFYIRRSLRILPAFFLALAVSWALDLSFVRESWAWFVLQGSNFLFFRKQAWGEGAGHFWSLAVEEQFYLLWPAVVLFTPARRLPVLLVALVLLGPVWRWLLLHLTGTSFSLTLLPAHLDLFAAGGLLGLIIKQSQWPARYWSWSAAALLVACAVLKVVDGLGEAIFGPSLLALLAAAALAAVITTTSDSVRRGLSHPVLVWLGQRSYGLYLYHLCLPVVLHRVLHRLALWQGANPAKYTHIMQWEQSPLALLLLLAALVVMAAASWSLVEQPLRNLGRRFAYPKS
ncbi:acyltransferase [Hymenobacter cavernae]|uniref:Acyltransferase n=1 Tax=Hymenobacter cavernae TaxID=2044852 RepID=A0ABQ1U104_9BACT|nr:acyltransferase [Hymenobacter cavernae]